jgi:hypothetical protein
MYNQLLSEVEGCGHKECGVAIIQMFLSSFASVSTKFMPRNPWEANSRSDSQHIPRLLQNAKLYFCVHKSRHFSLSSARWIQSKSAYTISLLSCHLCLVLTSVLFISLFLTNSVRRIWGSHNRNYNGFSLLRCNSTIRWKSMDVSEEHCIHLLV